MRLPNGIDPMLPQYTDKCLCTTCGLYFNSTFAFSRHRVGKVGSPERRCQPEAELRNRGWEQSASGHWHTPVREAWRLRATGTGGGDS